jgi:5-methyltetrahydropteroyltriglutamate--homocysteine methyltransferase
MAFASVVGREKRAGGNRLRHRVRVGHPEIVRAKLAAMSEGAALASDHLWK